VLISEKTEVGYFTLGGQKLFQAHNFPSQQDDAVFGCKQAKPSFFLVSLVLILEVRHNRNLLESDYQWEMMNIHENMAVLLSC